MSSSSASAPPAPVSRDFFDTFPGTVELIDAELGSGMADISRVKSLIFFLRLPLEGEVVPVEEADREGTAPISTVEYGPPAPKRPIIAGSR